MDARSSIVPNRCRKLSGSASKRFKLARDKNSEYDHDIPQSQTADNPMTQRGRDTNKSRDTRKTNYAKQPALSSQSKPASCVSDQLLEVVVTLPNGLRAFPLQDIL